MLARRNGGRFLMQRDGGLIALVVSTAWVGSSLNGSRADAS